jgi:hypothetical protein
MKDGFRDSRTSGMKGCVVVDVRNSEVFNAKMIENCNHGNGLCSVVVSCSELCRRGTCSSVRVMGDGVE